MYGSNGGSRHSDYCVSVPRCSCLGSLLVTWITGVIHTLLVQVVTSSGMVSCMVWVCVLFANSHANLKSFGTSSTKGWQGRGRRQRTGVWPSSVFSAQVEKMHICGGRN